MKTAVIPQVRVEPELRADLDAVLLPGETLTEFVEASVRRAVEFTSEADADPDRLFNLLLDRAETVEDEMLAYEAAAVIREVAHRRLGTDLPPRSHIGLNRHAPESSRR